jgi:DNA-binding response OmpR family regulator
VVAHLSEVDVVLLDLGLPDVDGVDVCRLIRETSDVPIIIVSARGEVHDRILGLHSGADDYLVKPYDVGELLAGWRRCTAADGRPAPWRSPGS